MAAVGVGSHIPFNKRRANEIRSRLLLMADKECNFKQRNLSQPRNLFRINSKDPEELKENTIFYIQLDNEDYNETTDVKVAPHKTLQKRPNPKSRMSISLKSIPSSKKSTKSLLDSIRASDKSEEENLDSPTVKDKVKHAMHLLRSPNIIKYITPIEFKISKSSKQAIKMKTMASFNYLQDKAEKLTIFKKKSHRQSHKGNSKVKLNRLDIESIEQANQFARKSQRSETIKQTTNSFNNKNFINPILLLQASMRVSENKNEPVSPQKFERSAKKKFNTIKHKVIILKPDSPLKVMCLKDSPKKGCMKKSSNMTLKFKDVITEIDGE